MEPRKDCIGKMHDSIRMTGFLEKKGKMKLMSQWKKYWFVLEKRLLLYYRSEIEYTNLSPCRGSLNMGLVTNVRPGSSSGPCVIHIVTRTQAIQLRAKNRAAQEEWLQALLHSMALPVVPKTLKPPTVKPKRFGQTSSLENVSLSNGWRRMNLVDEWSLPRKLNCGKGHVSGGYYGGSLDTAIWAKKFMPIPMAPSRVSQEKAIETFLELEADSMNLVTSFPRNLRLRETQFRPYEKNFKSEEKIRRNDRERKCKVHDDNRNRNPPADFLYGIVEKKKIILTAVNDKELVQCPEIVRPQRREESPFEKIKNAISRTPRERLLRLASEREKNSSVKKHRQSFLQKVFRRKGAYGNDISDSDVSDYFYDTIENIRRPRQSQLIKEGKSFFDGLDANEVTKPHIVMESIALDEKALYAEVRKNMSGSKNNVVDTVEPDNVNLRCCEILENDGSIYSDDETNAEVKEASVVHGKDETSPAPLLPPRRVSRPISPWHDVPTNNAPISSEKKVFLSHQAVVKFNDPIFLNELDLSSSRSDFDIIKDDIRLNLIEPQALNDEESVESSNRGKNDDLTLLLEQLTKITVTPLADADDISTNLKNSSPKSEVPDPDYDVPRPHRPLTFDAPQENKMTDLEMTASDSLEKSSSFQSIEPDSLEAVEKRL